jgi:hypothetical protein
LRHISCRKSKSFALALLILLQPVLPYASLAAQPVSSVNEAAQLVPLVEPGSIKQEYARLTKKILLSGIELERFSLNFRLESAKQPKFRRLRYFATQEAGAGCGLAFEIIADDQFGKGRRRPLQVSKPALHGALATVTTGSIIASAGSCLELGSNMLQSFKNKRHGYDFKAANKYVVSKLKQIDELLAQREALVAAHPDFPGQERAVIEGRILQDMRSSFLNEYSHFNADTKSYLALQNTFFFLNAVYNAVGAVGAGVAYKAVATPHLNGTANILFIASGGMASVAPMLSSLVAKLVRKEALDSLAKDLKEKPNFDAAAFAVHCKALEDLPPIGEGSVISTVPATQRLAIYTQSNDLFHKQLENETKTMRKLEKVAIQTSLLGPIIGSQLMTQGILGTYGYYHYPIQPRKQLNQFYYGAVVGTVGTSMAVVGNVAWLLSSMSYVHRLEKKKQLPTQLIHERLNHLDEIEKVVLTI